ncbi:hypothetical protein BJ912DRAFT_182577 [Pholiota molesta]|nr:hypothetical protein BJ912DRAFT_182577 [Pholiota molesta]
MGASTTTGMATRQIASPKDEAGHVDDEEQKGEEAGKDEVDDDVADEVGATPARRSIFFVNEGLLQHPQNPSNHPASAESCRTRMYMPRLLTSNSFPHQRVSPPAASHSWLYCLLAAASTGSTTLVYYFRSLGPLELEERMRWRYHRYGNECRALHACTAAWHALQHSSTHGAEDGTTSIRFCPMRCNGQSATGLYTPSPSYSLDGIWTLCRLQVLWHRILHYRDHFFPNDSAPMASPLAAMPASHTCLCSIILSTYSIRTANFLQPISLFSMPTPCVLANSGSSSLHLCDGYMGALRLPCDAKSTSFA